MLLESVCTDMGLTPLMRITLEQLLPDYEMSALEISVSLKVARSTVSTRLAKAQRLGFVQRVFAQGALTKMDMFWGRTNRWTWYYSLTELGRSSLENG